MASAIFQQRRRDLVTTQDCHSFSDNEREILGGFPASELRSVGRSGRRGWRVYHAHAKTTRVLNRAERSVRNFQGVLVLSSTIQDARAQAHGSIQLLKFAIRVVVAEHQGTICAQRLYMSDGTVRLRFTREQILGDALRGSQRE